MYTSVPECFYFDITFINILCHEQVKFLLEKLDCLISIWLLYTLYNLPVKSMCIIGEFLFLIFFSNTLKKKKK